MLGLQESHRQQTELSLDDFGFTFLHHDRTTAVGIRLPVNLLHLHTYQFTVLAQELKGVDVPTTSAALLMTRGSLERTRPVGPGVLRVVGSFHGAGHDLYLRHALAALAMGRTDAVAARVSAADNQHILALGSDALFLAEIHAGQHAVLLGEQFKGEVYALQVAAGN